MSSTISFSFNPSSIPAEHQPAFMARFFQLVTEYQIVTSGFASSDFIASLPVSPPADTLPVPSFFAPVDGDDTSVPVTGGDGPVSVTGGDAKKPRKNPWADLSAEQRTERLAAMKRGRDAKLAARKMSGDSLDAPAPSDHVDVVVIADPVPAPVDAVVDNASESSSTKKARKNPWASLTPEQHAAKVAAMKTARDAKKAASSNTSA